MSMDIEDLIEIVPGSMFACEACGFESDYYETEWEAEDEGKGHLESCVKAQATILAQEDPRTEREKWQDALDEAYNRGREGFA